MPSRRRASDAASEISATTGSQSSRRSSYASTVVSEQTDSDDEALALQARARTVGNKRTAVKVETETTKLPPVGRQSMLRHQNMAGYDPATTLTEGDRYREKQEFEQLAARASADGGGWRQLKQRKEAAAAARRRVVELEIEDDAESQSSYSEQEDRTRSEPQPAQEGQQSPFSSRSNSVDNGTPGGREASDEPEISFEASCAVQDGASLRSGSREALLPGLFSVALVASTGIDRVPRPSIASEAEFERHEQSDAARTARMESLGQELRSAAMTGDTKWVNRIMRGEPAGGTKQLKLWRASDKLNANGVDWKQVRIRLVKPDVNSQDGAGWSALHWAVSENHLAVATCLLRDHKANVNIRNQNGSTPLFWARTNEMARLLLVCGAENSKNIDGKDPQTWHSELGRSDIARHIMLLCTPKFALAEADRCFEAREFWLAIKLCELGMKYYTVYDGRKIREQLNSLRRASNSSSTDESHRVLRWSDEQVLRNSMTRSNAAGFIFGAGGKQRSRQLKHTATGKRAECTDYNTDSSVDSSDDSSDKFDSDSDGSVSGETNDKKVHKQEPRTSVDGDEATSGSLRKQQAAIYYCDHRKGQILLHGDGIYRLRDKIMSNPELKAEFNQILHGWVIPPPYEDVDPSEEKAVARAALEKFLEEQLGAVKKGRARSFIVPAGPAARPAGMKVSPDVDGELSQSDEEIKRTAKVKDVHIWRSDWKKLAGPLPEPSVEIANAEQEKDSTPPHPTTDEDASSESETDTSSEFGSDSDDSQEYVLALYDWVPQDDGQLHVIAGAEYVCVTPTAGNDDWILLKDPNSGDSGFVPRNYVRLTSLSIHVIYVIHTTI